MNIFRLQVTHDLVMLVDIDDNPYSKQRKGGIFIYEINMEMEEE